ADFEQAMKNAQAVSSANSKEMAEMTAMAREMGRTTSFTAKDAGNAMYFMGMAGWKSKEMIAGLPGILNLAATGQTDLALTADIVTKLLVGYKETYFKKIRQNRFQQLKKFKYCGI
ncbi:TPA: phage tail tape measure protein, partial [Clostridioides difficile]|nr:phage tail tape measure protein [Clostridioides difficile]